MNDEATTPGGFPDQPLVKPEPAFPSAREFCLEVGLYERYDITEAAAGIVRQLRTSEFHFDAHCVECRRSSTFKYGGSRGSGGRGGPTDYKWFLKPATFLSQVSCTRVGHLYEYFFLIKDGALQKIGQFPSLEDVSGAEIEKFRKVLGQQNWSELRKANGLFAHGIGIGSFVYLRRIFERLLGQHRDEYQKTNGPIKDWDRKRTSERIQALASVLPPALVEHSAAYAILSAGIHELSEAECRRYFRAVRAAILQVLEQDWRKQEEQKAAVELKKELQAI